MFDLIINKLTQRKIAFSEHASLCERNYMKTGGTARILVSPENQDDLIYVIKLMVRESVKYRVVGRMSNTLPADGEFCGAVIDTSRLSRFVITDTEINAECGARLSRIIWEASKRGLGGFEELFMIPASLGGALYNNASAHNKAISDCIAEATVYLVSEDRIKVLLPSDLALGYRQSIFTDRDHILISAKLRAYPKPFDEIKAKIIDFVRIRRENQPIEYPSLGSVFKRFDGKGAGYYIERAGLKGYRIGGAEVSQKHAGFIINVSGATSSEVIALKDHVKRAVYDTFSVKLEEEIEIL